MRRSQVRTSTVVHASEIDTDGKWRDVVYQMVLRLERRLGRGTGWVAIGPVQIRRSFCERSAAFTYMIQVISSDLL